MVLAQSQRGLAIHVAQGVQKGIPSSSSRPVDLAELAESQT